jgi:hypothetical protein
MGGYPTTHMLGRIVLYLGLIFATACGDDEPAEPSQLTGAVIAVDASSLTDVRSFTLKAGSKSHQIFIDPEIDYASSGFVPQHLRDHVVSGVSVRVEVERRAGRLYALSMEDA